MNDRLTGFSIRSERDIGVSVSFDSASEVRGGSYVPLQLPWRATLMAFGMRYVVRS